MRRTIRAIGVITIFGAMAMDRGDQFSWFFLICGLLLCLITGPKGDNRGVIQLRPKAKG